jgi:serine/threonine-protein kinase
MAAQLEPESTFAGYRIGRLLGVGGMGEVYRATAIETGRSVALKTVAPRIAEDERFRRRFERESRLARGLDHPNVVAVLDAGERDGKLFIVMEYVEGLDLAAVLALRGRLHPRHAAVVVAQVADGLDAAAAQGLVHRDVKPGNVFLAAGERPHAYLGDFGLSRHVASTSGLTRTGSWVGTIDYASPEQLQAAEVDQRTDVYALGAVLYEALTGAVPFERRRDVDKMMAHLSEPPPMPSLASLQIPVEFDRIVERAMAKAAADRYPTAGELGRDALAAAEPAGSPPPWDLPGGSGAAPTGDPDAPTAA